MSVLLRQPHGFEGLGLVSQHTARTDLPGHEGAKTSNWTTVIDTRSFPVARP